MAWPSNSPDTGPGAVDDDTWNNWQRRFAESDAQAGFEVGRDFVPFNQMNDVFTRAFRDPAVKSADTDGFFASYRMEAAPRRGAGFSQKDFALRNAAWSLSDIISDRAAHTGLREGFQGPIACDTPVAPTRVELGDPADETAEIRALAKMFGADLVGITEIDERWHYSHRPDVRDMTPVANDLPDGMTRVIVMGHAMDFDLVETYPSALAGASTGMEYSHEAAISIQLSAYIRNLGFRAVASMNDTALVIPYAIKAGLGEYGRNQMVLTPEYGPRVRFSKIFTDMPLLADRPRRTGMTEYCNECTVCADACPPKALPFGAPDAGPDSVSTQRGVKKWSADCEKCFGYWAKIKTDCAICMRVCPFNTRGTRRDDVWRRLALDHGARGRRIARRWHALRNKRERLKPVDWWKSLRNRGL
jgi:epoxyqueuosine reductase QueG